MPNRDFEYLLNAMEEASHHTNPAEHAYKGKREAVFAHVAKLSANLAEAVAALERLGSMEAFHIARAIDPDEDKELLARIDYARAILAKNK